MEKRTIGKFIAVLRKAKGMTQKELGDLLYVSDKTVSRWERDESTPDLQLIPVIAEIFGVSSDELLRGGRLSPQGGEVPTEQAGISSQKQVRTLLQRRLVKFQSLSLLAMGIAICGLLAAMLCNLGFNEGLVGFCVASVFLLAGFICQICFFISRRMPIDEDEPFYVEEMQKVNAKITRITIQVLVGIGSLFLFVLPLAFLRAHWGLSLASWLCLGLLSCGIGAALAYILYIVWGRTFLCRRGMLSSDEEQQVRWKKQRKLLLRTLFWMLLVFSVLLGAVVFMSENFSGRTFAKGIRFDSYAEFAAYTEEWAVERYGADILEDVYYDTLYGPNGSELCRYISLDAMELSFSFDKSEEGLPLYLYTADAMRRGWDVYGMIEGGIVCLMAADVLVGVITYFVILKRKIRPKNAFV